MSVRPLRDADYEGYAGLHNGIHPDHPLSGETLRRYAEGALPGSGPMPRIVVEDRRSGELVAVGGLDRNPYQDDPSRPWIFAEVRTDRRRQGIGSHLYATLLAEARRRGATGLRCSVREGRDVEWTFLSKRGFVERRRSWTSALDATSADTSGLPALLRTQSEAGIEFTDLEREGPGDVPVLQRLHRLVVETGRDVPRLGAYTPIAFEEFRGSEVDRLLPEAWMVAKDGSRYVGMSSAALEPAQPGVLQQWYTAVDPAYRRRRIAVGLKLLLIDYAKRNGYARILTSNDSLNRPMWTLNQQLGFRKEGGRIHTECVFEESVSPPPSGPGSTHRR